MKKLILVLTMVVLVAGWVLAAENSEEKEAIQAAEIWLQLVDTGKYGESWDEAAVAFKDAISRDKWEQALNQARKPLGKMKNRALVGAKFMTELPGAPAGKYVVIQFNTDYDGKSGAVETITPMLDEDGSWRVAGYFVK